MPFSSSVSGSAFLRARSSGCHPQCVQASSPAYSIMQHRSYFGSVQRFSSSAIPYTSCMSIPYLDRIIFLLRRYSLVRVGLAFTSSTTSFPPKR